MKGKKKPKTSERDKYIWKDRDRKEEEKQRNRGKKNKHRGKRQDIKKKY
jgi:hypothetical protein